MWVECWGKQALIFFHQSFPSSPLSPSKTTPAPHFLETMEPVSLPRWLFLIWVFRSHLVVGDWQQQQKMFCFSEHPNLKFAEVDGWGGDERDEILKSLQDCLKQGGVRSGTCASGFGVCCLCELDFTNDNLLAQKINSTNNDQLIFIICYTSVHLYAMNKKTKRRCEKVLNPGSLSFQSEINKVLGLHGGWTLNIEHWTLNSEQWTVNSEQWTVNQTREQNFCPIF